ncbi:MAG: hypothetical protein F4Y94_08620 [Chloroflexi bacterium]|nr:hypothetical protein [Chloroflexota bacterium]
MAWGVPLSRRCGHCGRQVDHADDLWRCDGCGARVCAVTAVHKVSCIQAHWHAQATAGACPEPVGE